LLDESSVSWSLSSALPDLRFFGAPSPLRLVRFGRAALGRVRDLGRLRPDSFTSAMGDWNGRTRARGNVNSRVEAGLKEKMSNALGVPVAATKHTRVRRNFSSLEGQNRFGQFGRSHVCTENSRHPRGKTDSVGLGGRTCAPKILVTHAGRVRTHTCTRNRIFSSPRLWAEPSVLWCAALGR
jgi:hypothetical protein